MKFIMMDMGNGFRQSVNVLNIELVGEVNGEEELKYIDVIYDYDYRKVDASFSHAFGTCHVTEEEEEVTNIEIVTLDEERRNVVTREAIPESNSRWQEIVDAIRAYERSK